MTSIAEGQLTGTVPDVARARVMTGYRFLVEQKLGQDVCAWVQERLDRGMSLRGAAREMTKALGYPEGIRMSHALLTRWCGATADDGSEEAQ